MKHTTLDNTTHSCCINYFGQKRYHCNRKSAKYSFVISKISYSPQTSSLIFTQASSLVWFYFFLPKPLTFLLQYLIYFSSVKNFELSNTGKHSTPPQKNNSPATALLVPNFCCVTQAHSISN